MPSGQADAAHAPPNSHPAAFGIGWECDWGYRQEVSSCVAVAPPKNAYVTAAGNSWKCRRGFRREDGACVAIDVPEHSFLSDTSFSGWRCELGYQARGGKCAKIELPANAYHLDGAVSPNGVEELVGIGAGRAIVRSTLIIRECTGISAARGHVAA